MKKLFFVLILSASALLLYAQASNLSTVGILPFEVSGAGVSDSDAGEATKMVIAELSSWGTMTILEGDQAKNGAYIVRGKVSRQDNQIILTAATMDVKAGKTLNSSKEQAQSLSAIPIESFCAQIAENIPYPNYLLGKWQSTINMVDGPVTCILEFRSDHTVRVQRFDTWEYKEPDSLRYQAIGRGSYTYAGYRRKTVTLSGRQISTDATVGINLTLEDALPKYSSVSVAGLRVLFDDSKSTFELSYVGIPCGDNFSGASVYPGANVYYTKFSKIQ